MNDLIYQFRQAIAAVGLTPPNELIDDGVIHRFTANGKTNKKMAGTSFTPTESPQGRMATGASALRRTGAARPTPP